MNKEVFIYLIRFVILITIQALVLNHINFLGYLNPYVYIAYILFAPITIHPSLLLILSFFLGLSLDVLGDSGGIHAASCLVIAYLRPLVLQFCFGVSYEFQTVKISQAGFTQRLSYVSILTLLHHFLFFSLETFSIVHFFLILQKTFFTSIFSILSIMLVLFLFKIEES